MRQLTRTILVAAVAMLLLAACGETSQPPVDIDATVEARVADILVDATVEARVEQALTAVPTATPLPPATATPLPPATATPLPPATATPLPPATATPRPRATATPTAPAATPPNEPCARRLTMVVGVVVSQHDMLKRLVEAYGYMRLRHVDTLLPLSEFDAAHWRWVETLSSISQHPDEFDLALMIQASEHNAISLYAYYFALQKYIAVDTPQAHAGVMDVWELIQEGNEEKTDHWDAAIDYCY